MEVLFPVNIENYQQMKLVIDQYLLPSMNNLSNETHIKKANLNNQNKTPPIQIRLTMKNLIIIIIFLERVKILRLIDNDPCLYNRDSKFKSTKESLDVLSRDFISSDTNLLRRLKLAGYEPTYKQTSLDEFNYLLTNNENKLFDELKDGIRLTRCAQILLSSTNEYVAKYDLSMKLKCPVVNLVHKLLNIDQAFELLQTYGHVNLTGIINKDIMNGNKQRTLELLWRIFIVCYLPKYLSPIDRLNEEITILIKNLSKYACSSIEQQLLTNDIIPLQKQHVNFTPIIHFLIKWVQLICAHYKFWLYDLQESFADGRAFLYIISYYLPSLCNSEHDIKHLTTLATCQTRDEHIQFNLELGRQQQQQSINIYERNVKSNFRLLEECIKQFGTFSYDLIKYEFYAKDLPDERCTIIILAMLAHDLLFLNNQNNTHNDIDFRHQLIFEELKQTYSNNDDNQSMIEMKKEEINNNTHREEIEIIQDDSINPSEISTSTEIPIEDIINLKLSISSSTINYSTQGTYLVPIIQFQEKQEEEKINDSLQLLSQSVLDTMNYDILDRLELLSQLNEDDDDDDDEDEDSFNSARSSSTTRNDHGRTSIAATMATISLDDFVELEKTIEKEENKTNNNNNHSSLFLADETVSSDIDNNDLNKLDETCFADPINKKMIKDTFTLFLSNQQQTVENPRSIAVNNQEKTEAERETHAADILQACWRGHQVRFENERNNHPIVPILKKIRSHNIINTSSLTIRERMMKIIQEFFEASPSSLTAYLHLLRDIEPIIDCCLEIRYLIVEHGLLRLFFILMRCCNRSGPSTILLRKVLHILQLFTIQHKLIMKLIDKSEQIKDFIMLLLKYYQNNGSELFEQICFLLQSIVNDKHARQILRSHKSFTETIEYIYKRLFNKVTIEDDKHQQLIRSTPKRLIGSTKQHTISLNQSSILQPMPKLKRASVNIQTENILKQNLISIEQFMKVFYCD